jgi:Helix-turn-helix domain
MNMHVQNFAPAEPERNDAKDIAALRWRAVSAFNCHPDLTPLAQRLGIHLISKMDARSLACFPSEKRLAAELNCDLRSLKRAKSLLVERGLIVCTTRRGWNGSCSYQFKFDSLEEVQLAATERGDRAVKGDQDVSKGDSVVTFKGDQNCSKGDSTVSAKVTPGSPYITQDITHLNNAGARDPYKGVSPPAVVKATPDQARPDQGSEDRSTWRDRKAKASRPRQLEFIATSKPTSMPAEVPVYVGTPQWKAWEAFRGKSMPAVDIRRVGQPTRTGWLCISEWPPVTAQHQPAKLELVA